jgi:hypothetical protein
VLEAVTTLAQLLEAEERHHLKKRHVFREITAQHGVFSSVTGPPDTTETEAGPARQLYE